MLLFLTSTIIINKFKITETLKFKLLYSTQKNNVKVFTQQNINRCKQFTKKINRKQI